MSYSLNIRAANKAAAKSAVAEKLTDAVNRNVAAEGNKEKAQAAADAAIDKLEDGKEIIVDVNGTLDSPEVTVTARLA